MRFPTMWYVRLAKPQISLSICAVWSVLLWKPIWPKITQKCVYGDEMFLSTKLLKHPSPIKRVLHINLDTSDVSMQHLCITAPKYGGLYRPFYDIRNTQFLSIFLVIRVQKWKVPDRLWCKLSAYQNMPNLAINYESVSARPLFRLNPQPDPSTLYSYNPTLLFLW